MISNNSNHYNNASNNTSEQTPRAGLELQATRIKQASR